MTGLRAVGLLLVGAACGAFALYHLDTRHAAERELRRVAEAEQLRAKGQIVEEKRRRQDAEAVADSLAGHNAELGRALEAAKRAAPDAKVVRVVEASTGPVVATAPVAAGDQVEIRVGEVELESKEGNHVLAGAAECVRVQPAPPAVVASGPFRQDVTKLLAVQTPAQEPPRWGFGPAVFGGSGWALGAVASSPPVRLLGVDFEVTAAAGLGSSGPTGMASLVLRP
jgi:hypothetical protein